MISVNKLSVSAYTELESHMTDTLRVVINNDVLEDAEIDPKTKTIILTYRVILSSDCLSEKTNSEIDALCR